MRYYDVRFHDSVTVLQYVIITTLLYYTWYCTRNLFCIMQISIWYFRIYIYVSQDLCSHNQFLFRELYLCTYITFHCLKTHETL